MWSFRKYLIREAPRSLAKQICDRNYSGRTSVIRVGERLPHCDLYEDFPTNTIQMPEFCDGRNIVLFAVSGAFAPGCSKTHIPGYLKAAGEMKRNGVDEIICVSVNDAYVMGAWAEYLNTKGKIRMFADPTGTFINALGLGMYLGPLGGFRAMRFSMVVINSVLMLLQVEPDGTGLCCSLADALYYKQFIVSKNKVT